MLQALLEDRFKLALHHETKQLPVFELTLGNGDAKLQPSRTTVLPILLIRRLRQSPRRAGRVLFSVAFQD